mmetsp:Transcript_28840/g.76042  ORF Transcript_28840/g.76042 Transcript_28840/m.76042 type:complete len:357 (+) Transcript_28840:1124-2194(+)
MVTQDNAEPSLLGPSKGVVERFEVWPEVGLTRKRTLHQPITEWNPHSVHPQITNLNEVALCDQSCSVLLHLALSLGIAVLFPETFTQGPLIRWRPSHHPDDRSLISWTWFPEEPSTKINPSPTFLGCHRRCLRSVQSNLRPDIIEATLKFLRPPHASGSGAAPDQRLSLSRSVSGMSAECAQLPHQGRRQALFRPKCRETLVKIRFGAYDALGNLLPVICAARVLPLRLESAQSSRDSGATRKLDQHVHHMWRQGRNTSRSTLKGSTSSSVTANQALNVYTTFSWRRRSFPATPACKHATRLLNTELPQSTGLCLQESVPRSSFKWAGYTGESLCATALAGKHHRLRRACSNSGSS